MLLNIQFLWSALDVFDDRLKAWFKKKNLIKKNQTKSNGPDLAARCVSDRSLSSLWGQLLFHYFHFFLRFFFLPPNRTDIVFRRSRAQKIFICGEKSTFEKKQRNCQTQWRL